MKNQRINYINKLLRASFADAFLLVNNEQSGQPGTRYVSGFTGSQSLLLVTKQTAFIITDGRYFSRAAKEAKNFTLVPVEQGSGYDKTLTTLLTQERVSTILIDGTRTSYATVERLKTLCRNLRFTSDDNILQAMRMVKGEDEMRALRKVASIAAQAFRKLLSHVKEGVTEIYLAQYLEFLMLENGADRIAFDTIVASGKNGAYPHARPTNKKLKRGELVTFDFGACYNGYASDTTRTMALGDVSPRLKEIYDVVKQAQELGCRTARAGMTGSALDEGVRAYIRSRSYGQYFLHATGHGLGMEVHELPIVSPTYDKKLPAGSVVTCEPGIYIEGLGGVRIEDTLVLHKNGNVNLTKNLSGQLMELQLL